MEYRPDLLADATDIRRRSIRMWSMKFCGGRNSVSRGQSLACAFGLLRAVKHDGSKSNIAGAFMGNDGKQRNSVALS
jgi:hypothetical protein